jgi:predicted lipoprotein with Yx(FWY)xxD motif
MFGPVLVDHNGIVLYTWVVDEPTVTMCYGSCATSWPPALVEGSLVAPAGLPGRLGSTSRTDGSTQLTYNDWPLYRYVRDTAPGEIGGDGSTSGGGLWPVATTGAVKPVVALADHSGPTSVLVDANGMTLYTWEGDQPATSACNDACAAAWPPVTADARPMVGAGLSRALGIIARDDGTSQVTFNNMPLYRFARDTAPGDMNGAGSTGFGAAWHVAVMETIP